MINKELKDMSYEELIAEAVGYTVQGMCEGKSVKNWTHTTIDLTLAWLREKGKLK